jgi:hypothetical protein
MKRLICLFMALCMMLCACATVPAASAPQSSEQTTVPVETEAPVETTAPPETTVPAQTTLPLETTEPGVFIDLGDVELIVRIEDPETMIYAGPGFLSGAVDLVGEAGTYTVVEEAQDSDGNIWGRLKSGAGWICLTEPALAPIYADFAPEDFNAYHAYWSDETDYITSIGFTPAEKLTDVKFGLLDWFETESWQMAEELYTMDELDPDHAFLAQVVFWGDMTTYGISFTDADGEARHFAVSISGKDGSLVCQEYE